jgi:hypothetical protein
MDRKVLAILLVLLTGVSLLVSGCADRKNAGGGAPPGMAPTITPEQSNASSGGPGLDPSLADISGEGNDLTGFPETGLPTPTLD